MKRIVWVLGITLGCVVPFCSNTNAWGPFGSKKNTEKNISSDTTGKEYFKALETELRALKNKTDSLITIATRVYNSCYPQGGGISTKKNAAEAQTEHLQLFIAIFQLISQYLGWWVNSAEEIHTSLARIEEENNSRKTNAAQVQIERNDISSITTKLVTTIYPVRAIEAYLIVVLFYMKNNPCPAVGKDTIVDSLSELPKLAAELERRLNAFNNNITNVVGEEGNVTSANFETLLTHIRFIFSFISLAEKYVSAGVTANEVDEMIGKVKNIGRTQSTNQDNNSSQYEQNAPYNRDRNSNDDRGSQSDRYGDYSQRSNSSYSRESQSDRYSDYNKKSTQSDNRYGTYGSDYDRRSPQSERQNQTTSDRYNPHR